MKTAIIMQGIEGKEYSSFALEGRSDCQNTYLQRNRALTSEQPDWVQLSWLSPLAVLGLHNATGVRVAELRAAGKLPEEKK